MATQQNVNTSAASAATKVSAGANSDYQRRQTAFKNASELDMAAKHSAAKVLRAFVLDEEKAKLIWSSAKVAHTAAGFRKEDFINSLDRPGGLKPANWISHPSFNKQKDPYQQLELQAWHKYLYYGGTRMLVDANGTNYRPKDQDLVMKYFGIYPEYEEDKVTGAYQLKCDYSWNFYPAIDCRNKLGGHSNIIRVEELDLSTLMKYYDGLLGCLLPLTTTYWVAQDECKRILQKLKVDFFSALGVVSYRVEDIMVQQRMNPAFQPQIENLMRAAGLAVADGRVSFRGDIKDVSKMLSRAWWYYQLSNASGVEQLKAAIYEYELELNQDIKISTAAEDKPAKFLTAGGPADWTELAERYLLGIKGVEQDITQAKIWYEKAAMATSPDPKAMYALGQIYEQQEPVMAKRYYSMAADKGYSPAQVWMGIACEDGLCGQSRNWKEAFEWYEKAAKQNNADGLCHLGQCYESGRGVEQNKDTAASYYQMAQSQGSQEAKILGAYLLLCTTNQELRENKKTLADLPQHRQEAYHNAQKILRTLAEEGVPLAQGKLGRLWYDGEINGYMQAAAEAGDRTGQYWMGVHWWEESGAQSLTDPDSNEYVNKEELGEAREWFRKAALQGHVGAQLECDFNVPQKAQWLTEIAQQATGEEAEEAIRQIIAHKLDGWEYWVELAAQKDALGAVTAAHLFLNKNLKKSLDFFELAATNDTEIAWDLIAFYQCGKTTMRCKDGNWIVRSDKVINPQRALEWMVKLGHTGDLDACRKLAKYYLEEKPGKKDPEQAIYWYQQEARHGHPEVYCEIAQLYMEGKVIDKNITKAVELYNRAGKQGYLEAYNILAKHCMEGKYVRQNRETAILYYQKGLTQALALGADLEPEQQAAMVIQAVDRYLQPDMPIEVVQAACQQLKEMAECHWVQAMVRLGHCYLTRKDLARGPQEGIRWLTRAYEETEEMDAAFILATIYREGILVPQDLKRSLYWMEQLAPAWDLTCSEPEYTGPLSPQHQYIHGGVHSYGELSSLLETKGGGWYLLAQYYDKGWGTREDQSKAFACYRKSWEEGFSPAREELVRRYQQGIGVKPDPDMAQKLPYFYKPLESPVRSGIPQRFQRVPNPALEYATKLGLYERNERIHNERIQRLKEERAQRLKGK